MFLYFYKQLLNNSRKAQPYVTSCHPFLQSQQRKALVSYVMAGDPK